MKIIDLELCVDCPLFGKHVPAEGSCFELIPRGDKQETSADIQIPTKSNSGGFFERPEFFYTPVKKCQYFEGPISGAVTKELNGISCSYSEP